MKTYTFKLSRLLSRGSHFIGVISVTALMMNSVAISQTVYPNPLPVDLLSAGNFRVLAGSAVTNYASSTVYGNVGATTVTTVGNVNGNLGGTTLSNSGYVSGNLWGTTVTNSGTCDGTTTIGTNSEVLQAQTDYALVYSNLVGRTADNNLATGSDLGGTTLGRGIYASAGTFIINGTLTLTGTSSDIFIFKMVSTLTTGASSHVVLTGGALVSNVYWQVGSSATIDGDFKGNILALTAITQNAGATSDGSLFTRDAAIEIHGISVLPVELTSFTAALNNGAIELNWNTATETNNYGFEVQRSQASYEKNKTLNYNWAKIGFVNGAGNSNSPKNYYFADNTISYGGYAYRLKQLDKDGNYKYSKVAEINAMQIPNGYLLSQNFPIPFNPSTTISFTLPERTRVELSIYNEIGENVVELFNGEKAAGYHSIEWNASKFVSGIYFYELKTEKFTSVKKLILMK